MIKLTLVLLSTMSQNIWAYPYFYYDAKAVHLSDEQFSRYVRPQIKNIVTEYYHILKKINPLQGQVIQIKNQLRTLNYQWTDISQSCLKKKKECSTNLNTFYHAVRKFELEILKFEKESLVFATKKTDEKSTYQLDLLLNLKKYLNDLSTINYENLHIMEELLIDDNTSALIVSEKNHKIIKSNLTKILVTSELMISGQMDQVNRKEFYFLFANFIKNLEKNILREHNKNYFLQRLGELNMVWNSFHMKMVKGHHQLPKKLGQIIIIMHNRWNSLLKLLLKN